MSECQSVRKNVSSCPTHRLTLRDEALQHVGQRAGLGRVERLAGPVLEHQLDGGAAVLRHGPDLLKPEHRAHPVVSSQPLRCRPSRERKL